MSEATKFKPLDDLEQRLVLAGAALAVFMSVVLNLHSLPFALIGVVMAVVLVFGARRRSRFTVAVGAYVLAFGPWHVYALAGTPFLLLGLWLWYRGRPSPEQIEARRQARDAQMAEKRAAREAKRGSSRGSSRAASPDSTGGDRRPPERSKRYTPPARKR